MNYPTFPHICKDCKPPKRHIGCHGTCKEFKNAKAEYEKKKEQAIKEWNKEKDFINVKKEGVENVRRSKHGGGGHK